MAHYYDQTIDGFSSILSDMSWIKHKHFSEYENNNICEEWQQLRIENKDKQLGTSEGT